jgi:hypothetical protein
MKCPQVERERTPAYAGGRGQCTGSLQSNTPRRLRARQPALPTGNAARVADLCGNTLNPRRTDKDETMLYTLIAILVVLWLLGFTLNVGGGLIHTLLVIAAVIFLFNLINGRRSLSSS